MNSINDGMVAISEPELLRMVSHALLKQGVIGPTALAVAKSMVSAERDGTPSHGLERLESLVQTLKSGWISVDAIPTVIDQAPGVVVVDAGNGFVQGALERGRQLVIEKAKQQGVATLSIKNSHHFGALWVDVEPFAEQGMIAIAFVHSRSRIVGPGAHYKILGTNPMAFSAPRSDGYPFVWDQASSVISNGDVLIAAREGRKVPDGCGVDKDGGPTRNPKAILDGGALVPFGGYKGFSIAIMVEIMSACLTGSLFGHEDESKLYKGAHTTRAGQQFIVIDPHRSGAPEIETRIDQLLEVLKQAGTGRLPGERRYERRRSAEQQGLRIETKHHALLTALLNG